MLIVKVRSKLSGTPTRAARRHHKSDECLSQSKSAVYSTYSRPGTAMGASHPQIAGSSTLHELRHVALEVRLRTICISSPRARGTGGRDSCSGSGLGSCCPSRAPVGVRFGGPVASRVTKRVRPQWERLRRRIQPSELARHNLHEQVFPRGNRLHAVFVSCAGGPVPGSRLRLLSGPRSPVSRYGNLGC